MFKNPWQMTGLILMILMGSSCATKSVQTKIQMPPRSMEMREPRDFVVAGFDGQRGGTATQDLRSAISRARYHTLKLEKDAPDVLILSGNVAPDRYSYEYTSEEMKRCVKRKKKKCVRHENYTMHYLKEACVVDVSVRVLDTRNNQVLLEDTYTTEVVNSDSQKNKEPKRKSSSLCQTALKGSMKKVSRLINPHEIVYNAQFMNVSDEQGLNDAAIVKAEIGKYGSAQETFSKAMADPALDVEERAKVLYNIALTQYLLGQVLECAQSIDEARDVLGPQAEVNALYERCWEE